MWVSELLPYTAKMVDDMCFIRSMHTEAINHEPAITYMQTGNQITGRPCLGAWVSYGLGSLNENLPTFVVLVAKPTNTEQVQAISARLWSSGYLSGEHAGVSFRTGGDPILYINNPPGVSPEVRRKTLDGLKALNEMNYQTRGRPRDAHAHRAVRAGLPHAGQRARADRPRQASRSRPSSSTATRRRSRARFANTALLARRMVERGVRFVQIYHNNWDTHGNVAGRLPDQCRDVDQACCGLIQDLKQRGPVRRDAGHLGRRVRPDDLLAGRPDASRTTAATIIRAASRCGWPAAARRPGTIYGETDDFSYNIVKDPVHIHDFHATVLHLLGFDHQRFTYRYQGLDQRLTGVEPAERGQGVAGVTRRRRPAAPTRAWIEAFLALRAAVLYYYRRGRSCASASASRSTSSSVL